MRYISSYIAILTGVILFSGCSVSKHVPDNERLYVGGSVKVQPAPGAAGQAEGLETSLDKLMRPVPNSTLFGYPYKVGLYYLFGEPKREKGFAAWFRRKFGEPPVFVASRNVTTNTQIFQNYLNNKGYFRSTASGKLVELKGKKAKAEYTAYLEPRYFIDTIRFVSQGSSYFNEEFLASQSKTLLKTGDPYNFATIEAERQRIDQYLKTKGFYYFSADNLIAKVDSTIGNHKVNIYLQLKSDVAQTAIRAYTIRNILVDTDFRGRRADSATIQGVRRASGLIVRDEKRRYKPFVFDEVIGFRPGSTYNSEIHNVSLSRLINLKNFKFVRNRFDIVTGTDSAMLDVNYYLTPMQKKSLKVEINASTKSNNTTGTQLDLSWTNKNIFGGAEYLRISGNVNANFQLGGAGSGTVGNDYRRYMVNAELGFPRFVIPFYNYRPGISKTLPSSSLKFGYEVLQQPSIYSQNSTSAEWGYSWSNRSNTQQALVPFRINLLSPGKFGEAFINKLLFDFNNPPTESDLNRYFNLLEQRLILESTYNISYNLPKPPHSKSQFVFNGGLNLAGNIAGLLVKKDTSGIRKAFGIPIEQYARIDLETKYYQDITPGIKWANRFFAGFGLPYGNSQALPQIRQYFAGGSVGLRGFQARNIGPGAAFPDDSTTQSLFRNSSFGDVKLELNSELRMKLSGLFQFALFADAGNVWSYRINNVYGEETVFKKNFYKQLAVDGGIGLRMDFTYLVFRLDIAMPFRKPWYTQIATDDAGTVFKNPWVFNEINLRDRKWRSQNLILNIAIGLPF